MRVGRWRACIVKACVEDGKAWPGERELGRAGPMRAWGGAQELRTSWSLEDDHEQVVRLNVREPGGAQLPALVSACTITRTRRRLQGLGWVQPTMGGMHAVKQAKHCSESTCSFQVAVKGASTSSGTLRAALGRCGTVPFSLNLRIFPALPASTARLEARGGQIQTVTSL